jgi:transcriptional regulator with XRE-family HTH domain
MEPRELRAIMKQSGLGTAEMAERLGYETSYLKRVLKPSFNGPLPPKMERNILNYLVRSAEPSDRLALINRFGWEGLFDEYVGQLRTAFYGAREGARGAMLEEIIEMAGKYASQKTE